MNDRVPLYYHQATFDLIEREPLLDIAALASLDQCEAAYGFPLPASVREWYSLKGATEILYEFSNQDDALTIAEMQEAWEAAQSGQVFKNRGEWNYHGLSVLPIIIENQSIATWAVHLNGPDDPPVLVIDDDDEWKPYAERFSHFVAGWVWSHLYWCQDCLLVAEDQPLSPEDLSFLRETFTETRHSSGSSMHHFRQGADKHVHVWAYDGQKSYWQLRAESKESLLDLTSLVWRCGTLGNTLEIDGGYIHGCAGKVLEILRFGHELPEPDWKSRHGN